MAMFKKFFFVLFALEFTLLAGVLTLLRVLWTFLTHPFTTFKKIPRESKCTSGREVQLQNNVLLKSNQ